MILGKGGSLSDRNKDRKSWNDVFQRLKRGKSEGNLSTELLSSLEILEKIAFPNSFITPEDCSAMIILLTEVVPCTDELLSSKLCQFIVNICESQKLSFRSVSLSKLIEYLLACILRYSTWFKSDAIRALSSVIFFNGDRCSLLYEKIIDSLLPLVLPSANHIETKVESLKCIELLCMKGGSKAKEYHKKLFNVITHNLKSISSKETIVVDLCKVLIHTLSILTYIIKDSKDLHLANIANIFRNLQQLLTVGLNKDKNPLGEDIAKPLTEEESKVLDELRLNAVVYLQSITLQSPVETRQHVFLFIPESEGLSPTPFEASLLTVIQFDPVQDIRYHATIALFNILEGMPFNKWIIDKCKRLSVYAFKPQSIKIVDMLFEVHSVLLYILQNEKFENVLCGVCKCLASLLGNVPYHFLDADFMVVVVDLLVQIEAMISENVETSFYLPVLNCFSAAFHTTFYVDSIGAFVLKNIDTTEVISTCSSPSSLISTRSSPPSPSSSTISMLALKYKKDLFFKILNMSLYGSVPLRIQALNCVSKLGKHFGLIFHAKWLQIVDILQLSFAHSDPHVRLHAVKVIEAIFRSSSQSLTGEKDCLVWKLEHLRSWGDYMSTKFVRGFHDSSSLVRAAVSASISNLYEDAWLSIPNHLSHLTILNTLLKDEDANVRASTCKAIGVLALFKSCKTLEFDSMFISPLLKTLKDDKNLVRVQGFWAVANVCNRSHVEGYSDVNLASILLETLSLSTIHNITNCMLEGLNEDEKIVSNAIRCLGYVGVCLVTHDDTDRILLEKIMNGLSIKINTGSPKVRWNSCYAIGKLLSMKTLGLETAPWAAQFFSSLSNAISTCQNYKVRINAASTLSMIETMGDFGASYTQVVETLINSLQSIDKSQDFSQYKYKDQLLYQLAGSLTHVLLITDRLGFAKHRLFFYEKAAELYSILEEVDLKIKALEEGGSYKVVEVEEDGIGRKKSLEEPFGGGGDEGGGEGKMNTRETKSVYNAIRHLARLYDSQTKTIPTDLLAKYQSRLD